MWILPKSLISAFALDTEVLTSDSVECSQICAQSLIRRSKPSPANSYLREWKAAKLMRLRSGAISSPSLGQSFLEKWTSCLADIHASPFLAQGNDLEQKTSGTSGPTSQAEFVFSSPESASLKMSKDTSVLDSEKSLQSWKALVTKRRLEYSARLNAAQATSANECLSSPWPTPSQRDYKGACASRVTPEWYNSMLDEAVIVFGPHAGPHAPVNPSTTGSRPESWATPQTGDYRSAEGNQIRWKDPNRSQNLNDQMKTQIRGKLNARWVETLMGLPIGWTMPSCAFPVTIAPTNCDCSETE